MGLVVLWLCAIIAIADGVLGICLTKCRKRCLVMLYGSGLGVISVIVFIVGCIFAFQSSYMPSIVSAICTGKNTPQIQPFMQASYLDTNMLFEVNKNFCSQNCPCDANLYNLGYTEVPESKFNFNGRTKANAQGKIPITTSTQSDAMKSW